VESVHDTKRVTVDLWNPMPTPTQAPFSSLGHLEKKTYLVKEIPKTKNNNNKGKHIKKVWKRFFFVKTIWKSFFDPIYINVFESSSFWDKQRNKTKATMTNDEISREPKNAKLKLRVLSERYL
jgi:hypothetical protein